MVTLIIIGTFLIAYYDYSNTIKNIGSSITKADIDKLLFASYSESDKYNKINCFTNLL